jgi:hypothetical protein
MSNFPHSFDEAFKEEEVETTLFCTNNNVSGWHSGGGLFHYAYQDKDRKLLWLINHVDYDEHNGKTLPTKLNEEVICSLDLNNIEDEFNDFDTYTKIISELDINGVIFENDYTPLLWVRDMAFDKAIALIQKTTEQIIKRTKKQI